MIEKDFSHCQSCNEPVEDEIGIIDLDENGLCEICTSLQEFAKIIQEEDLRYMDFDYSMNY